MSLEINQNEALSFEDAIKLAKAGTAVRSVEWPQSAYISPTAKHVVPHERFWSKHNAARARASGGELTVNSSFTKFDGEAITMGWIPTNDDIWSEWVIATDINALLKKEEDKL